MKKALILLVVMLAGVLPAGRTLGQPRVLSLQEAVDVAISGSTSVGIYRERLNTARQNVLRNNGLFLPNFNASFYAGHSYTGPTSSIFIDAQGRPVNQAGFDYENYSFSLNSSMTLFDWGANVKMLSSAKRSSDAATYEFQYQKDIVTARVIRAYYDVVRKKNLRSVQEQAVQAAQRNLDQVEAFFKIGSNTKADVLQAKVRLGNTRLQRITTKNAEEISRATLASILNLPMDEQIDVEDSLELTVVEPNLNQEIEYMLGHRSDLHAGHDRLLAATDAATAVQNARWPTISAGASYRWSDRTFPDPERMYFFKNEYSWGLGVQLNWDIFDRFATKSDIQRAKAERRIAEEELKQSKLDAILEVKQLYLVLTEGEERILVSEETVSQAEENVRLAEERYRVGAGTMLETIESAATLQEAQGNLVNAKCDYLIAKADLLRATGRAVEVR